MQGELYVKPPRPATPLPGTSNSHFARRVPRQDRHDRRSAPRSAPDRVARRRRLAAQGEVRRQNENCWSGTMAPASPCPISPALGTPSTPPPPGTTDGSACSSKLRSAIPLPETAVPGLRGTADSGDRPRDPIASGHASLPVLAPSHRAVRRPGGRARAPCPRAAVRGVPPLPDLRHISAALAAPAHRRAGRHHRHRRLQPALRRPQPALLRTVALAAHPGGGAGAQAARRRRCSHRHGPHLRGARPHLAGERHPPVGGDGEDGEDDGHPRRPRAPARARCRPRRRGTTRARARARGHRLRPDPGAGRGAATAPLHDRDHRRQPAAGAARLHRRGREPATHRRRGARGRRLQFSALGRRGPAPGPPDAALWRRYPSELLPGAAQGPGRGGRLRGAGRRGGRRGRPAGHQGGGRGRAGGPDRRDGTHVAALRPPGIAAHVLRPRSTDRGDRR